jgi:hypothetical protein
MAQLKTILDKPVPTHDHLAAMLYALFESGYLTWSQMSNAKSALGQFVPNSIKVEQRTPKSVTFFNCGEWCVRVTNRARVYVEATVKP